MFRRLLRRIRVLYRAASASLAWRLVLGAAAITTISLVAAAIALPQLYRDGLERQLDFELDYLLNRLITRISAEANGELILAEPMTERDYESAYSGYYWQITSEGKIALASRSLAGWMLTLRAPEGVARDIDQDVTFTRPPEGPQRLRAVSRTIRSDTLNKDFIYTVAAVRTEMDENIEDFRLTIVLTILGLGLVLIGTVTLQVRFGLGPLRRIPEALAAIRSGENDRLTGSFSAEVEPLAREINALLDHNAEVVDRARTHVGNLAHALKTPIAVLTNEAAGQKGGLADTVKMQVGIMKEQVDHHLSRARMAARAGVLGARTSVMPVLEGLARTLEKIHRARAISVSLDGPPEIAFRGERQDLEEMLGNLLDNACKYAKVRVTAKAMEREGGRLRIEIADDGPGVPSEHRRAAQKRGVRLDEKGQGSGLGLSIVNDIAEIYGGSFTMDEAKLGGLLAILDLPLAGAPTSRRIR
jgi:signal transduction histidine kinase